MKGMGSNSQAFFVIFQPGIFGFIPSTIPLMAAGGLVTFVLAKVTKTVSAEMLLCRTGLRRTNQEKPWAVPTLVGSVLTYRFDTLHLPTKVGTMPCPLHRLAGFSCFLPKLIC
jgi:hypothetical protein